MPGAMAPQGDAIRRAVRFISDARRDRPGARLAELVDEAAREFDLGPLDQEFLWKALRDPPPEET